MLMSGLSVGIMFYVAQKFGTITTENQNHKITEYRNNKGILNAKVTCQVTLENRNNCASQDGHHHQR